MSGPPAARLADPIGHENALANFLAKAAGRLIGTIVEGIVIGVVAAAIVGATVLTGGLALVAVAAVSVAIGYGMSKASEAAGVELSLGKLGEMAGDALCPINATPTGTISTGSANVLINKRFAARATAGKPLDIAACSRDSPVVLLAEGAKFVVINNCVAVRKGDHTTCGAVVMEGSANVLMGGPQVQVRPVPEAIPTWARWLVKGINIALAAYALFKCKPSSIKNLKNSLPCLISVGAGAYGMYQALTSPMPVHAATGTKILPGDDDTDFVLPGPMPIVWTRVYSSSAVRKNTLFGEGWSTPYSVELRIDHAPAGVHASAVVPPGDLCLIYVDMSGREMVFPLLAPGESHISITEGYELMRTEGGEFVMRRTDGLHQVFDLPLEHTDADTGTPAKIDDLASIKLSAQTLLLRRLEDRNGNYIALRYENNRRLSEITDTTGRLICLQYAQPYAAGSLQCLRLAQIRLIKGAPGETPGILASYGYDANAQLSQVMDRTGSVSRQFSYLPVASLSATTTSAAIKPLTHLVPQHVMSSHTLPGGLVCHYEWQMFEDGPRVVRYWSNDGESRDIVYDIQIEKRPTTDTTRARLTAELHFKGGRTRSTDQLGRMRTWAWNKDYLISACTDELGYTARFEYNADGLITKEIAPDGGETTLQYDALGNPVSITTPLGQRSVTRWVEPLSLPSAEIAPDGSSVQYTYDTQGNLVSETVGVSDARPQGFKTIYSHSPQGLVLSITDAKEGVKHLRWNERAHLVSYTDCSSKTTAYDYDGYGHLKTITDASGQVTRLTHDAMGALLAVSQPDGSNQSYQYDSAGRLIGATDPLSRSTRFTLNSRGQLTQRTDAANRSVALGYDEAKRLSTLTNENHEQYQFVYDAADRMVEEIRVGGTRVTLDYDVNDQPIAVTMHPGIGDSVQAIEGAATEADKPIRTELIRDAVGRLIEKRSPTHHYHYKYDLMDRLVEATKLEVVASGAVSGQPKPVLELQLQPLHKTDFKYNKLGDLIEETATDLITGEAHTLTHAHDELGNRTQTTLPKLPNSPAFANTQRALNYLHYGSGHLHQINLSQTTTLASKDARGNAETIHQLIADIERDDLHQETQRSQGAVTTRYAHDPLGRRTAAWSQHSGLRNAAFKTNDPAWQQALQKPTPGRMDGLMKGYAYDLTGELRQTQHSLNGRTQHKYDATGRIEESLRAARQAGANASANSRAAADPNRSESFGYDPAGNLLDDLANRATNRTASQSQGQNRGYVRDNLVRVFEDKRYAYDGHGRLIQKLSGKHTKQSFQWDDEHRLMAITTTRRPNTPEATTQTIQFDYDAIGRRVAKHDSFGSTRFIWEGMRLIEERREQSVVTYVYEPNSYVPLARIDAMGQATQAGGVGTKDDALPADRNERDESAANDEDSANPNGENTTSNPGNASNIYYFHTDQVGLPEELSDSEGTIRWRASYKTWGNAVSESWEAVALNGDTLNATAYAKEAKPLEVQQNLRFQGQYLDRESGLHYNTFRFYDPDIGRFISPDPIGLWGGENLSSYSPNPLSWIDPLGLLGEGETAGYGSKAHRGDGLEAHEILRNKYLQDRGVGTGTRVRGNPSVALSPANHDAVHAEEARLRRGMGLGPNDMLRSSKAEIRLMNQAINNTMVRNGTMTIQQLRTARRMSDKFARSRGC